MKLIDLHCQSLIFNIPLCWMSVLPSNNALEAANLYFEDDNVNLTHEDITFEVDFKQFFQYYKILNSKFLAYSQTIIRHMATTSCMSYG